MRLLRQWGLLCSRRGRSWTQRPSGRLVLHPRRQQRRPCWRLCQQRNAMMSTVRQIGKVPFRQGHLPGVRAGSCLHVARGHTLLGPRQNRRWNGCTQRILIIISFPELFCASRKAWMVTLTRCPLSIHCIFDCIRIGPVTLRCQLLLAIEAFTASDRKWCYNTLACFEVLHAGSCAFDNAAKLMAQDVAFLHLRDHTYVRSV